MFSGLFVCQSVFPTLFRNIQGEGVTWPFPWCTGAAVYKQLHQATPISWCLENNQVSSSALWDRSHGTPFPEYYGIELERLTDRQTGLKTLPSHKLHMWAVINVTMSAWCWVRLNYQTCIFQPWSKNQTHWDTIRMIFIDLVIKSNLQAMPNMYKSTFPYKIN